MPKRTSTRSARGVTSITYWRKFASHRIIYLGLAGVFGVGIIAYFGAAPGGGGSGGGREGDRGTIATVNGTPIDRSEFDQIWSLVRRQVASQGPQIEAARQGQMLSALVDQALVENAAKAKGVTVSDSDVERQIDEMKQRMTSGKAPPTDEEVAARFGAENMDDLRAQLRKPVLRMLFGEVISGSRKLTLEDVQKTFDEAKVRQILIGVSTSPYPVKHSLPDEQAKAKAEKVLAEVKAGKPFDQLANQYTDDVQNVPQKYDAKLKKDVPNGAPKGGDLGWIRRDAPYPDEAVVNAAFALKPGAVSELVKSPMGYHILKVEQIRRELPKDFDKQKTQLLEQLRNAKSTEAVGKVIEEARKTAKIVWKDPSYEWKYLYAKASPGGMGFIGMADPKDQKALLDKLAAYCPAHAQDSAAALVRGSILYQQYSMGGIVDPRNPRAPKPSPAEREKLRADAVASLEQGLIQGEDTSLRMTLAQIYRDMSQPEKALKHYKRLHDALKWDSKSDSRTIRQELVKAFMDLNEPTLAQEESDKLKEIAKKEAEDAALKKKYQDEAKAAAAATKVKPGATTTAPGTATTPPPTGTATKPAAPQASAPAAKPGAAAPKPGATAPSAGGAAAKPAAPK